MNNSAKINAGASSSMNNSVRVIAASVTVNTAKSKLIRKPRSLISTV